MAVESWSNQEAKALARLSSSFCRQPRNKVEGFGCKVSSYRIRKPSQSSKSSAIAKVSSHSHGFGLACSFQALRVLGIPEAYAGMLGVSGLGFAVRLPL